MLIDALNREGVADASILDVGAGVGAIYHELFASGLRDAVHVDVSPDYLGVAREEAERRGHAARVQFVRGDFVDVAAAQSEADVVTLDRVICCYPNMERLVTLSAEKARRLVGAVYPREAWWVRFFVAATNAFCRLRRTAFRAFVHPPAAIDAVLHTRGFERRSLRRTLAWEVVVYARRKTRDDPTACPIGAEGRLPSSEVLDAVHDLVRLGRLEILRDAIQLARCTLYIPADLGLVLVAELLA
jgi:magnesium-protoporphyrin O-methyltransferase